MRSIASPRLRAASRLGLAGPLTLLTLLLPVWACLPSAEVQPLGGLYGEVELAAPLTLVPGLRWREHADGGKWLFGTYARLLVVVRESAGPLEILLVPDTGTTYRHYELRWDGEPLLAEPMRPPAEGLRLTIPAEDLTPGRHELYLRRIYRRSPNPEARSHENSFRRIAYTHAGAETELAFGRLEHYRRFAGFLRLGGLGDERLQRDGLLMVGPAEHGLALTPGQAARFVVEPWNHSRREATFEISGGGEEARISLPPGEGGRLALDLAGSERALLLRASGEAEGLFLWGLPRIESPVARELTPVVVVTLDTTRRDALGPYGAAVGLTPNLDALASGATVFEEAFSTSPWTLPSHASLFTGLYPSRHRAGVTEAQLPPGTETLARLFRDRGYLTAGFSSGELSSSRFGLALGFSHYRNPDGFETRGGQLTRYLADFLGRYGTEPLFLFVNVFDPHALYDAPEPFAAKLGVAERAGKLAGQPIWEELAAGRGGAWQKVVDGEAPPSAEALAYLEAAYLAEVSFADHVVGELLGRLRELGLYERALIVVTADHGELLGEGGYFSHSVRLDPELVEIPLIVKWPGQTQGRRVAGLVSLVDLFPTILEAAGLEPPPSDGRSLTPERAGAHPFVFLEEHESLVHPLTGHMRIAGHLFGVQKPSFRQIVWAEDQECQRRARPTWETVPCAAGHSTVLAQIEAALSPPDPSETQAGTEWMSPEMRQKLEALGYL